VDFVVNEGKFDDLQPWFVGDFILTVKRSLEEGGLSEESIKDVCGTIVFNVCAQLDGSSAFEVAGKVYTPVLAFSEDEKIAFYPGYSANLHEYVYGVLDEIFEDDT